MEFKNKKAEEDWKEGLEINKDPYGRAVYIYAQRWAEMIEKSMKDGDKLKDVAKELGHEADLERITGFMYGCAVGLLSQVWKYGKELREWHNLDIQFGNEGEKANEKGTVLNPAIINIGEKENG